MQGGWKDIILSIRACVPKGKFPFNVMFYGQVFELNWNWIEFEDGNNPQLCPSAPAMLSPHFHLNMQCRCQRKEGGRREEQSLTISESDFLPNKFFQLWRVPACSPEHTIQAKRMEDKNIPQLTLNRTYFLPNRFLQLWHVPACSPEHAMQVPMQRGWKTRTFPNYHSSRTVSGSNFLPNRL